MKGITVTLYEKTQTGTDAFGVPVYSETATTVDNVLVAPETVDADGMVTELSLAGRKALYVLGIPKGDSHEWEDRRVRFWNQDWKTVGPLTEGIEEMIPLSWNRKIRCERIES